MEGLKFSKIWHHLKTITTSKSGITVDIEPFTTSSGIILFILPSRQLDGRMFKRVEHETWRRDKKATFTLTACFMNRRKKYAFLLVDSDGRDRMKVGKKT